MANQPAPLRDPVLEALQNAPLGAALTKEERAALAEAQADVRQALQTADIEATLAAQSKE